MRYILILFLFLSCQQVSDVNYQAKYDSLLIEKNYADSILCSIEASLPQCIEVIDLTDTTYYMTKIIGSDHLFIDDSIAYFVRLGHPVDTVAKMRNDTIFYQED